MGYQRGKKRLLSDINVVPYIDVMLVLLVIFMITAPLIMQGIPVKLPETQGKHFDHKSSIPMIVSVNQQGQLFLNIHTPSNVPLSPKQLAIFIQARIHIAKQNHQTLNIFVRGDEAAPYGKVMHAMSILKQAGCTNIGLITRPNK